MAFEPPQTVPWTEDRVFKHWSLWGTFSFKPPHRGELVIERGLFLSSSQDFCSSAYHTQDSLHNKCSLAPDINGSYCKTNAHHCPTHLQGGWEDLKMRVPAFSSFDRSSNRHLTCALCLSGFILMSHEIYSSLWQIAGAPAYVNRCSMSTRQEQKTPW